MEMPLSFDKTRVMSGLLGGVFVPLMYHPAVSYTHKHTHKHTNTHTHTHTNTRTHTQTHAHTQYGQTALHLAAEKGHGEIGGASKSRLQP